LWNEEITRWLLRSAFATFGSLPEDETPPATCGSGPFEEGAFDDLLEEFVYGPALIGSDTPVLVVGREDWQPDDLRDLVRARSGKKLRVYSQELYLAYLITRDDPLAAPAEELFAMADNHPALLFLQRGTFWRWPSTQVPPMSLGGWEPTDFAEETLHHQLGYRVGKSGLLQSARREKLQQAMFAQVPPDLPASEWGAPGSCARLEKIANCIASSCRLAKKRTPQPLSAIAHWESDLKWLHDTFYIGRCRFQWPSTDVP